MAFIDRLRSNRNRPVNEPAPPPDASPGYAPWSAPTDEATPPAAEQRLEGARAMARLEAERLEDRAGELAAVRERIAARERRW